MMKKFFSSAIALAIATSSLVLPVANAANETVKFNFGEVDVEGYTTVSATEEYNATKGYGFLGLTDGYSLDVRTDGWTMTQGYDIVLENGQEDTVSSADDTWVANTVSTDGKNIVYPIRFAYRSTGNQYYNVKINLKRADVSEEAYVNLFTEKRHQHLLEEPIPADGLVYETSVYVHNNWSKNTGNYEDRMLNIVAEGENVAISSIEITPVEQGKTLWILGDSTVCEQSASIPYFQLQQCMGVGSAMAKYLGPDWAVVNEAESGLSASAATNHFNNFINDVKEGDVVWFQFGHNDAKISDGINVSYLRYLENFYSQATAKGADFIVVGPIDRCTTGQYNGSIWSSTLSSYSEAGKNFVEEKIANGAVNIAFVDLNAPVVDFLNEVTAEMNDAGCNYGASSPRFYYYVNKGYTSDYTHPNDAGADNFARMFVDGALEVINENLDYVRAGKPEIVEFSDAPEAAKDGSGMIYWLAKLSNPVAPIVTFTDEDTDETKEGYISFKDMDIEGEVDFAVVLDTDRTNVSATIEDGCDPQAYVLYNLLSTYRDYEPFKVPAEIYTNGVAPNDFYPSALTEIVLYDYPLIVDSVTFDDNGAPVGMQATNVASAIEYGYGRGLVAIYDSEGTLKGTVKSDDVFDRVASTVQNVVFTAGEVVYDSAAGDTFEAYVIKVDADTMLDTEDVVSTTYTQDDMIDIKELLIDENWDYSTTLAIGDNITDGGSWTMAGGGEFSMQQDTDGEYYVHLANTSTGTMYPYRKFTAVPTTSGQLMFMFDLRYTSGNFNIHLTDGSAPNQWKANGNMTPLRAAVVGTNATFSLDGTDIATFNTDEWTKVKFIIDFDYGKYYLTVGGTTYTADAAWCNTLTNPAQASIAAISFTESTKSGGTAYDVKNLKVATLNTAELPEKTLTLATDAAKGSVTGAGSYTKNTTVTATATPAEGYNFYNWTYTDSGEEFSTDATVSFRLLDDMKLTANYVEKRGVEDLVSYTLTPSARKAKLGTDTSVSIAITNPLDSSSNKVDVDPAADVEWSLVTEADGLSIADGVLTISPDYQLEDELLGDYVQVKAVANNVERTATIKVYPYDLNLDVDFDNGTWAAGSYGAGTYTDSVGKGVLTAVGRGSTAFEETGVLGGQSVTHSINPANNTRSGRTTFTKTATPTYEGFSFDFGLGTNTYIGLGTSSLGGDYGFTLANSALTFRNNAGTIEYYDAATASYVSTGLAGTTSNLDSSMYYHVDAVIDYDLYQVYFKIIPYVNGDLDLDSAYENCDFNGDEWGATQFTGAFDVTQLCVSITSASTFKGLYDNVYSYQVAF